MRNAYVTYLYLEDNSKKFALILHSMILSHDKIIKAPADIDRHASY